MKNIFFILSTPRCRSTWFSNLFTYKNTFCYNEELRYMTKWSDFEDRIKSRSEKTLVFQILNYFIILKNYINYIQMQNIFY